MNNAVKVQGYMVDFIKQNFPSDRVICLIAYGSSLNISNNQPEDYDFLLTLKSYDESDYRILRKVSKDHDIELFIDYWDQVLRKGFNNYQRGRHGTYFFACLAYAKCLINKNIYAANLNNISKDMINRDLLFRIEEYFYRIQKVYLNDEINNNSIKTIRKYFSRICLDLLLYLEEISFSEVHIVHYDEVIRQRASESTFFTQETKDLFKKSLQTDNLDLVPSLVGNLYQIYLRCFSMLNNK